jgi:hypothetical protein
MYLCYIDESGTPDVPGNTSHYILAGFSIPVEKWKECDNDIARIKSKYQLFDCEIHVAWILRQYLEQKKIPDFEKLDYRDRRFKATAFRTADLLKLQRSRNNKLYRQTQKNYRKTDPYVHLTFSERKNLILDVARTVSGWGFGRLFAECIDKIHFDPARTSDTIDEQCFEQVVSRFERYLQIIRGGIIKPKQYGLLIHDNNETVAKKHTDLMKKFHKDGTLWTKLQNIIETPLFVNSELTGMVQIADLCGYALRRYLENGEEELFDLLFSRADRNRGSVVGVRHFSVDTCKCKICSSHRKS